MTTDTDSTGQRFRLGLLFDSLWDDYEEKIWHGVVDEARAQDANLLCFAGGSLESPLGYHRVRTVLHDVIGPDNVDGLLVVSGCLGAYLTRKKTREYLTRFAGIPLISIGIGFDDIPSIVVDNRSGMYDLVSHFIQAHGRRRIAFITGPQDSFDAEERFAAYRRALADHDIPLDPQLIVHGNFLNTFGEQAAIELVSERRVEFDALVAANDSMALGAMRTLLRLGIDVPAQVLVGGFDDTKSARSATPTLTTVRQPTYEIGRQAVRELLTWLRTAQPAHTVTMPTRLVIRDSCGCAKTKRPALTTGPSVASPAMDVSPSALADQLSARFIILTDILGTDHWARDLVAGYLAEYGGTDAAFGSALEALMREGAKRPIEPDIWIDVLQFLFHVMAPHCPAQSDLKDAAVLRATQYVRKRQSGSWLEYQVDTETLQRFLQPMSESFEFHNLSEIVREALPRIGINGFSLSFYDDTLLTTRGMSHLALRLDPNLGADHTVRSYSGITAPRFQTRELAADSLRDRTAAYYLNVFPLSFENEHFGIALYDIGNLNANVYEIVTSHLISLIKGVRLLEQTRNYTHKLKLDVELRTAELRTANEIMRVKSSQIEELNAELVQTSRVDALTGVYNRRATLEMLKAEFNRTRRHGRRDNNDAAPQVTPDTRRFAVMMLDIDHFKTINDTYGHLVGDGVLRGIGELLKEAGILRQEDVVGRFGGEEFIVILIDTDAAGAELPAQRLNERLRTRCFSDQRASTFSVTCSIGISEYVDGDTSEEAVVYRADQALYYAKNHGRDQIVIYEELAGSDLSTLQAVMRKAK